MVTLKITALVASLASAYAFAQTPPVSPPSAFAGYQLHSEKNPLIDWRGANNLMEKLDGHMGHVRGGPRSMKPAEEAMPSKPAMSIAPEKIEMKKP